MRLILIYQVVHMHFLNQYPSIRYNPERVAALGFDLAAAHFIVHRGGKVRFKEAQEWVQQDEDGIYELTRHYHPGVFVEEIDASGVNLVYEGLESMSKFTFHQGRFAPLM